MVIESASANGKIMAQPTASLAKNQLLCISQYAFNEQIYNPGFTPHADVTIAFNLNSNNFSTSTFSSTSNEVADYHTGTYVQWVQPDIVANSLSLGTTLGINGYYGSGSGKIVQTATFASNYVFSLSTSHYTNFVTQLVIKFHIFLMTHLQLQLCTHQIR